MDAISLISWIQAQQPLSKPLFRRIVFKKYFFNGMKKETSIIMFKNKIFYTSVSWKQKGLAKEPPIAILNPFCYVLYGIYDG